jgi:hypothetical protein
LESAFFALVKFIMCLIVPEVKAVSREQVMHMQVLESNKKNGRFRALRMGPETGAGMPCRDGLERPIRAAPAC